MTTPPPIMAGVLSSAGFMFGAALPLPAPAVVRPAAGVAVEVAGLDEGVGRASGGTSAVSALTTSSTPKPH